MADTSLLVDKITFVVANINFKVAVITSSVVKITFIVTEITFKMMVITSWVVEITFVMAEIFFRMAVITPSRSSQVKSSQETFIRHV